jgi:hypothetical protein
MTDLTQKLESSLSFARELNALKEQNRVLRKLVERYASECGECGGEGGREDREEVDFWGAPRSRKLWIPCHECADIRAALTNQVPT